MNINAKEARKLTNEAENFHLERIYNIISQGIRNRAIEGKSYFHYSTFSRDERDDIKNHFIQLGYRVNCTPIISKMKYDICIAW